MAYIPPHKRHSDDPGRPAPTPELLAHSFKRNLNLKASRSSPDKSGKIIYADHAKSNWFPVGLNDDNQIPSSVQLEPVSVEFIERRIGGKPLALVNDNIDESNEVGVDTSRRPWELITENVLGDLLSSFELLKAKIDGQNLEKVKPSLVARFGKILFHGSPSLNVSNLQKSQVSETTLKKLKRLFYSNVPMPYMDNVVSGVSPNIGDSCEKDIYHLKLSDKTRPEATISCKCGIKEDNKLTLYKVELNHVRYFVADISCLGKNLDMRLMLCSKNILIALTDDELHSIKELIDSAVIDPNVKGGLRWPLGKASSGDRFSVCGVWHTIATSYGSQTLRLKIRHADRFDFRTGTGECTREIILKLRGLLSKLQTSVAFMSFVIAAVPTLYAMGRAATSLSKLADTAREELPSTMAAIRLSGMEISDLTLELSDLSQEIADGVNKSAQAVQAAEAGIRQISALARQQTISLIQERASLPIISLQPVVAGAAKKTSSVVGRATKTFMNIISRGEFSSNDEDESGIDRVEM